MFLNAELGVNFAQVLANFSYVLMRGHGSTVVGKSIEQVVYRAINAKLQIQATTLGDIKFLSDKEVALAAATNGTRILRSWNLWLRRFGAID